MEYLKFGMSKNEITASVFIYVMDCLIGLRFSKYLSLVLGIKMWISFFQPSF